MIFKNIKFIYALLLVGVFACDPMQDVYDDLDKGSTGGVTSDVAFTMTEDDFELALPIAENGSDSSSMNSFYNFSDDQARKYIPYILSKKFPQLAKGSSANVTYAQYQGNSAEANTYSRASLYDVEAEDYTGTIAADSVLVAAGFLSPSYDKEAVLSAILSAKVQDATDGDVYGINYQYASEDPVVDFSNAGVQNIHREVFETDIDGYTAISLVGDQTFGYNQFFNGNAAMSGFSGGSEIPNDDWLVSPSIDLSEVTESKLKFHQVINFLDVDPALILKAKISADFSGDVTAATWTELTVDQWPAGNSWSEEVWSTMDISAFDGQVVNVAFQYVTTETLDAPTWEIGEVILEALVDVSVTVLEEPESNRSFFTYSSGSWELVTNAYYLTASDYDAMGAPGQYDNFSSSLPADSYITTYLSANYPYAQEEDEMVVVYKYFSSSSGSTQTRSNLYTVVGGSWTAYTAVIDATLLFAFDGTTWVPDNTIKLTFGAPDYTWISDNFADINPGGASNMGTYGNFSCFEWSEDQIFDAITSRLEVIYSSIEEGQKYQVTYSIYCGASTEPSLAVIYQGGTWEKL